MIVTVELMGRLERALGEGSASFELADGAALADLLRAFGDRYADRMPASMWNRAGSRFRSPVVLMGNGKALRRPEQALYDGQKIRVFEVLTGG